MEVLVLRITAFTAAIFGQSRPHDHKIRIACSQRWQTFHYRQDAQQ
jgi:hypothetical protein